MRAPPLKDSLSPKQLRFLEQLGAYRRREGVTPTVREMQPFMGLRSPLSVGQHLDTLERSGLIERGVGARNIRTLRVQPDAAVPDRVGTVQVAVVGSIAAGLPILSEENVEEKVPVSGRLARHHTGTAVATLGRALLEAQFVRRRGLGIEMPVRSAGPLADADEIAASCQALAKDLLSSLET